MQEHSLFVAGIPYERVSKKALIDGEIPVFICEFANTNGGVLTYQNTIKKGESFWVIQKSNNYKKVETSVKEYIKKIALDKKAKLSQDYDTKKEECDSIGKQIDDISKYVDSLKERDEF